MLKLSCDVISDLLPLYYDDACTTDSRSLVEAHLKDCAACRSMLEKCTQNTARTICGNSTKKPC